MKPELNPFTYWIRRLLLLRGFFLAAIAGALPLFAQKATDAPATPRSTAVRNVEQRHAQQQTAVKERVSYPAAEDMEPPQSTDATVPVPPPPVVQVPAPAVIPVPVVPFPKFDNWPVPPPFSVVVTNPPHESSISQNPALTAAAQNKTLYSFRAEGAELKAALAMFGRANKLNIVPDQDVTGLVTLDVVDLPLERLMQALLESHDFAWSEEEGLIRVRATQTRSYSVNYLRMTRSGKGSSAVTLSSSSTGGSGGAGGGGAGGGGGGGGAGGGGAGGGGGSGAGGSSMNLDLSNPVEFWKELQEQLEKLVTVPGREGLAINRTAGLIQVTDRPSAHKRIEGFLAQMGLAVARQVDLEAKLYDVTLNNQSQFGVDWQKIAFINGGDLTGIGSPFGNPSQVDLARNMLRPSFLNPGGGAAVHRPSYTMIYESDSVKAILNALQEQGEVNVISQPRLRTLNNQTAIMKVGTDQPFFTRQTQITSGNGAFSESSGDTVSIITVGTVLAITPQIAADGWITLDITPAITSFVEEKQSPSGDSSAPVLDIKQSSTIVRMRDGETIVMGGLIQNGSSKAQRKIPILGDIPGLGKLFQGNFSATQKKELVIFLTPTIVR